MTSTEQHRRECEARYICELPTLAQRQAQLARVERVRGKAGRKYLEDEVRRQWEITRGK